MTPTESEFEAAIAAAFEEARDEMRGAAVIPDSSRVWRMAQLRARREDAKLAGRPITAAQVLAFACATGLLGACFGATSAWFQAALRSIATSAAALPIQSLLAEHSALALGTAAVLILVPAAVCLAMLRD
jgi:hypothetical protein